MNTWWFSHYFCSVPLFPCQRCVLGKKWHSAFKYSLPYSSVFANITGTLLISLRRWVSCGLECSAKPSNLGKCFCVLSPSDEPSHVQKHSVTHRPHHLAVVCLQAVQFSKSFAMGVNYGNPAGEEVLEQTKARPEYLHCIANRREMQNKIIETGANQDPHQPLSRFSHKTESQYFKAICRRECHKSIPSWKGGPAIILCVLQEKRGKKYQPYSVFPNRCFLLLKYNLKIIMKKTVMKSTTQTRLSLQSNFDISDFPSRQPAVCYTSSPPIHLFERLLVWNPCSLPLRNRMSQTPPGWKTKIVE